MAETTFLNEQGVLVTNTRFVVPPMRFIESGQTYAMAGITSVRKEVDNSERFALAAIAIIGVLMLVVCVPIGVFPTDKAGGIFCVLMPVAMAGIGGVGAVATQPNHKVFIRTAAGEMRAIVSRDGAFIDRIIEAVGKAIAARG